MFLNKELDVRFAALYNLNDCMGRFLVLVATVFISKYPWVALAVNLIINCWLAIVTEKNKPSSIPWINVILTVTFGASAWCSAMLLLDYTGIPWVPMGLLLLGWIVLFIIGVARMCSMVRSGAPSFRLVEAKGVKYADTEPFDDRSLLRGFHHKIHSITTFTQHKELKGFQCVFKVDYMHITGPRHLGLQETAGENIDSSTMTLDPDENVKFLMVENQGNPKFRGINKIEFHTTKSRVHEAGESSGQATKLAIKPPGGAPVMGFHGGTAGHIHNIGLVVENTY